MQKLLALLVEGHVLVLLQDLVNLARDRKPGDADNLALSALSGDLRPATSLELECMKGGPTSDGRRIWFCQIIEEGDGVT